MNYSTFNPLPDNPGIAIVGVSGSALDNVAVERGLQVLRDGGFTVHNYYQHEQLFQRFGATDIERISQIHRAVDNPDVQIILDRVEAAGGKIIVPRTAISRNMAIWLYF